MSKSSRKTGGIGAMIAIFTLAVSGCDSQPTQPTSEELDLVLAALSASQSFLAGAGETSSGEVIACPAGGEILSEGERTLEREDEVRILRWDLTVRHMECGLETNGALLTITGEVQRQGEAQFAAPVDGTSTLLMQEARQVGSKTITRDGETFTCDLDLTVTFDGEQRRFVVTGTACGREVQTQTPGPATP